MANNRKRLKSKHRQKRLDTAVGTASRLLGQLPNGDPAAERLAFEDVALKNLLCASELPGAMALAIDHYLQWLDEAADTVRIATAGNYHKFLLSPGTFDNSQARFCMVCLVTVLQQQCGVRCNPKWKGLTPDCPIPESFGVDFN